MPYGRHSSRHRVAAALEPPTRGLGEQRHRPLTWCCSGWRLPRFTRFASVLPVAKRLVSVALFLAFGVACANVLSRLGVTQHPALRSPDFPPLVETSGDGLADFE